MSVERAHIIIETNLTINNNLKHQTFLPLLMFSHFLHFRSEITNTDSQNDYESSYNALNEALLNKTEMPLLDHNSYELLLPKAHQSHHHHLQHQLEEQDQHLAAIDFLSSSTSQPSSSTSLSSCNSRSTSISLCQSACDDTDLEMLDRELNALDASMPLIDPEITQGVEQLEKAISRKRLRSEEEDNDRLVREALSQFYLPSPRLLSGIDDCPLLAAPDAKRNKSSSPTNMLNNNDLIDFQSANQNAMDFEVIMDALRLGTGSNNTSNCNANNDSCGQAAMMSENGVFHNLVVASLET